MLASGFELINLADTVAPLTDIAAPESSDDCLDPIDFLSQSRAAGPSVALDLSFALEGASTPRLLLRTPLSPSPPAAVNASLVTLGDSLADSFAFLVPATAWGLGDGQNPLVFLQTQQDTLVSELRRHVREHQATLAEGDDCGPVRHALAQDLSRLSETCVLLHEACGQEQAGVEGLVADFEKWDRRRSKVLRHIQQIKSDSSKYGTKLAALLRRRQDVDLEVDALEARIAALKAQRSAISREIGETSSVLESKSARYVNVFRDLEQKGRDVISEYLASAGVRPHDLHLLMKSEPVDAGFSMAQDKHHAEPASNAPAAMGAQAYEVSETPLAAEDAGHHSASPYAQGYASGVLHLSRLKHGISGLVHGLARPAPVAREDVDDALNTITEKIDLSPILNILRHKIEAIEDLALKTSRLSAFYNQQSLAWRDVCKLLESQEKSLILRLNDPTTNLLHLVTQLEDAIGVLTQHLDSATSAYLASATPKENFLGTLIHHELKALTDALELLEGNSSYTHTVDNPAPDFAVPKLSRERLSMRITAAGYQPPPSPTTGTNKVSTALPQDSVFALRPKNMKSE